MPAINGKDGCVDQDAGCRVVGGGLGKPLEASFGVGPENTQVTISEGTFIRSERQPRDHIAKGRPQAARATVQVFTRTGFRLIADVMQYQPGREGGEAAPGLVT